MKPSVFAAWDLKEYNEKEHSDIMQVVPKYEYDELTAENNRLNLRIKELESDVEALFRNNTELLDTRFKLMEELAALKGGENE